MRLYRDYRQAAWRRTPRVVAIGVFDGVHRGHRTILRRALVMARDLGAVSMAITFDCHPHRVLEGPDRQPPYLMTLEHRLRCFQKMGFDECLLIRFTRAFSKTSREAFLEDILLKKMGVVGICVGQDFRFGHRGLGDGAYLRRVSASKRFKLCLVKPLKHNGRVISSTRIRRLIEAGRTDAAQKLLGRPVSVFGKVIRGRGRGRKLGFPTANLDPHHEALPRSGVYAAIGYLDSDPDRGFRGVVHIGSQPTFNDRRRSFEIHLLGFHRNVYGKNLEVFLIRKIRPTRRYRDARTLSGAIERDCLAAKRLLSTKALRTFSRREGAAS